MKKMLTIAIWALVAFPAPLPLFGQAHDRREAAITTSGEVHAMQGGTTIAIAGSYDKVFDGLVAYFQKAGYSPYGCWLDRSFALGQNCPPQNPR